MRSAKVFFLIWLCLSLTQAWADLLPSPHIGGRQITVYRQQPQAVGVSMAAAQVKVRIKKSGAAGVKTPALTAEVDAGFDMLGAKAVESGKEIDVLFPVAFVQKGHPRDATFAVEVDGKAVTDLKKRTWTVSGKHGNLIEVWGYGWRLPGLKTGQKLRVLVRYSLVLQQYEGEAPFTYFLRSGAQWDGPIGSETVNVKTDKGLGVKVLSPVALKPAESAGDSLTWKIIDQKPAEDITLEISPGVK